MRDLSVRTSELVPFEAKCVELFFGEPPPPQMQIEACAADVAVKASDSMRAARARRLNIHAHVAAWMSECADAR
eukprot:6209852-Pleurochrysis_carterae.AAC.5